jgi:hypothetical protein
MKGQLFAIMCSPFWLLRRMFFADEPRSWACGQHVVGDEL